MQLALLTCESSIQMLAISLQPSSDQIFRKTLHSSRDGNLEQRLADVTLYYNRLLEAGVNVPKNKFTLEIDPRNHSSTLIMDAEQLPHTKTAFAMVAEGNEKFALEVSAACFAEMVKVLGTFDTDRPVGYDAGLANFIYLPDQKRAYAFDLYPPRLAFKVDPHGKAEKLDLTDTLVSYPDMPELSSEKISRLQTLYYTRTGMLVHILAFALSSFYAKTECSWAEIKSDSYPKTLTIILLDQLSKGGFLADRAALEKEMESPEFDQYLEYRMQGARKMHQELLSKDSGLLGASACTYSSFPKWTIPYRDQGCHQEVELHPITLILAAGGKGQRLIDTGCSTPKPLVVNPHTGQTLIEEMIAKISQDFSIQRIVLAGSHDTKTAQQVFSFLQKLELDPQANQIRLSLNVAQRQGVTEAFFRGLSLALEHGISDVIISVADTYAESYQQLQEQDAPYAVGVSKPNTKSTKPDYTRVHRDPGGQLVIASTNLQNQDQAVLNGIYFIRAEAVLEFHNILAAVLQAPEKYPNLTSSKGELRLSWIWNYLESKGRNVHLANLGQMTEINQAADLEHFLTA